MKNNPTILFLHGALGTSQELLPLMDIFQSKGLTTLSFDFLGHGSSSAWPEEFRIDLFAHQLDHFIKKNSLTNPIIFGHSMGGYVALYHKAHFEDSPLARIFTYGTKFNWNTSAVSKEIGMLDPENILMKVPVYAEILEKKHGQRWKALLRSTAHMLQNLEQLDGLTKEDLNDIQVPVNFLLGDQDNMVTLEETQINQAHVPHSEIRTISQSKHDMERANISEIASVILGAAFIN